MKLQKGGLPPKFHILDAMHRTGVKYPSSLTYKVRTGLIVAYYTNTDDPASTVAGTGIRAYLRGVFKFENNTMEVYPQYRNDARFDPPDKWLVYSYNTDTYEFTISMANVSPATSYPYSTIDACIVN